MYTNLLKDVPRELTMGELEPADFLTPRTRLLLLRQVCVVDDCADVVHDMDTEATFRLKHTELDRSALCRLSSNGLIQEAPYRDMGAVIDWEWTPIGRCAIAFHQEPQSPRLVLEDAQVHTIERHFELIEALPPRVLTFQARDYELNSSLLSALHRRKLVERVEQRQGAPDVWRVSQRLRELRDFLFVE